MRLAATTWYEIRLYHRLFFCHYSVPDCCWRSGAVGRKSRHLYFLESNQHKVTLSVFKCHIFSSVKSGLLERGKWQEQKNKKMHNFLCNWCHLPFNSCHTKLTEWVGQEAGGVVACGAGGLARLGRGWEAVRSCVRQRETTWSWADSWRHNVRLPAAARQADSPCCYSPFNCFKLGVRKRSRQRGGGNTPVRPIDGTRYERTDAYSDVLRSGDRLPEAAAASKEEKFSPKFENSSRDMSRTTKKQQL